MFDRVRISMCAGALALALAAPAAFAGTVTVNGTLGPPDPTMPVVAISTPNCTAQLVTPVQYEAIQVVVDVGGTYTFSQTSAGSSPGFASLYLMNSGFNPAAAFPNCLAASNGADPLGFTFALVSGVTYFAVPFDDQFAQPGGPYTLTISGPGNIFINGASAASIPALSSGALAVLAAMLVVAFALSRRRIAR